MKISNLVIRIIALLFLTISLGSLSAASESEHSKITSVINTFNESLSAKNLDGMLSTFAPGSVQLTLRAAHAEMAVGDGISSDLKTHWSTIGPVLFTTMKSYTRTATIADIQVDGDVASVWTRINTVSVALGADQSRQSEFTELYLIVNAGNGWKIGAVADNRKPDSMIISQAD